MKMFDVRLRRRQKMIVLGEDGLAAGRERERERERERWWWSGSKSVAGREWLNDGRTKTVSATSLAAGDFKRSSHLGKQRQ
jgi:hypothetical protein